MTHSKGNWKVGALGTVVTDNSEGFPPDNSDGRSSIDYYGGYLVAESILKKSDAQLISAAPDMLEALIWARDQFKKLADMGRYPEFMLSENGGEGIMPIINAINKAKGL